MNRPTTEDPADVTATCGTCKRRLAEGESAWASDWKVIDFQGAVAGFRIETRYTCDDCEAAR